MIGARDESNSYSLLLLVVFILNNTWLGSKKPNSEGRNSYVRWPTMTAAMIRINSLRRHLNNAKIIFNGARGVVCHALPPTWPLTGVSTSEATRSLCLLAYSCQHKLTCRTSYDVCRTDSPFHQSTYLPSVAPRTRTLHAMPALSESVSRFAVNITHCASTTTPRQP